MIWREQILKSGRDAKWIIALLFTQVTVIGQDRAAPRIDIIANAASYYRVSSPGTIMVAFGAGIGPNKLVSFDPAKAELPLTLGGVEVWYGTTPAPILYVSDTQTAFVAPFSMSIVPFPLPSTSLRIVRDGVSSGDFRHNALISDPGMFTVDASGTGHAAALDSAGRPISSLNPVKPGDVISVFLTGCGQTDPPGLEGRIANGPAKLVFPLQVNFASRAARVLYSGTSPGSIYGLTQVNFVVPGDLRFGGGLPVEIVLTDSEYTIASPRGPTVAVAGAPAPVPAAPTDLTVRFSGANVLVSWKPGDDIPLSHYYIEKHVGPAAGGQFALIGEGFQLPGNVISFVDKFVTRFPVYYRVWAESDHGILSAFSPIIGL